MVASGIGLGSWATRERDRGGVLLPCVTTGYGYHSPVTSVAALEEEGRSEPERAAAALAFILTRGVEGREDKNKD